MKLQSFFKNWSINDHPFKAEEARQDTVFARLHGQTTHPDYEKICGDLTTPASSIVFGEKGSGKTAIRLQLKESIADHNERNTDEKILPIAYDELNPVLDRFARRVGGASHHDVLKKLRLVDHIDGILSVAVPGLVDALVHKKDHGQITLSPAQRKNLRKQRRGLKFNWILLQLLYDRATEESGRVRRLRKALRFRRRASSQVYLEVILSILLLILAVSGGMIFLNIIPPGWWSPYLLPGLVAFGIIVLLVAAKTISNRLRIGKLSKQLAQQLKVRNLPKSSYLEGLRHVAWRDLKGIALPVDDLEEPRYHMIESLAGAIEPLGYTHMMGLVDRVDEPSLVCGDIKRMRAIVWPLLNNKLLQNEFLSLKLLLPLELRNELFRESSDFFQEVRLDKQNLIERLSWSGPNLYDLCNSRLNACRDHGSEPISLADLFDDSVQRQDLVDALDQMRQPRDAFKLIYQVIHEHCSNITEEEDDSKIPKLVLDHVRRRQANRLEGLQQGVRPA